MDGLICVRYCQNMLTRKNRVALSLLLVLAAGATRAEEPVDSPFFDYGPYFRNTAPTNDKSDSKCIGYTISPMCALETYLASELREDKELRAIALGEQPGPPKEFKKTYVTGIFGYRVVAVQYFTRLTTPPPEANQFGVQEGDVGIKLDTNVCTYAPCTEPALNSTEDYLLRKGPYGWHITPSPTFRRNLFDPDQVWSRD
ncbi:MAG: hypothetical protein A2516_03755 [Alphaproteobacteria bacterium RIFOXYD12_FULL_60_8]|nr:MAG: hypothetical protein A2516_03755 [Alphaproteobacteria bacterium RIFOXYD12_FULL_60_8]